MGGVGRPDPRSGGVRIHQELCAVRERRPPRLPRAPGDDQRPRHPRLRHRAGQVGGPAARPGDQRPRAGPDPAAHLDDRRTRGAVRSVRRVAGGRLGARRAAGPAEGALTVEGPPPIRYATTSDGLSVAWQSTGNGPPLVWMPSLGNLVAQWRIPFLRRAYE